MCYITWDGNASPLAASILDIYSIKGLWKCSLCRWDRSPGASSVSAACAEVGIRRGWSIVASCTGCEAKTLQCQSPFQIFVIAAFMVGFNHVLRNVGRASGVRVPLWATCCAVGPVCRGEGHPFSRESCSSFFQCIFFGERTPGKRPQAWGEGALGDESSDGSVVRR